MINRTALIESICREGGSSSRLKSPVTRFVWWSAFCWGLLVVLIPLFGELRAGLRHDLESSPWFILEIAVGYLSAMWAAYFAFQMIVPTRVWTLKWKIVSVAPFVLFNLLIFSSLFFPALEPSWEGWRFGCEREIFLIGILPAALLFYLASKSLPLEKSFTGVLIAIASMTPAATTMHVACMYLPGHTLLFHNLPIVLLGLVASYIARTYLKN